jgi:hypothetical protein
MANYRGYAGVEFPTAAATDDSALNLGLEFYVTEQAWFLGGYTWQPSSNSPSSSLRTGVLWEVEDYLTGTLLAQAQMSSPPTPGENLILLDDPVELVPNQRYRWGVLYPNGRYVAVSDYYASGDGAVDKVVGPLTIPSAANATGESVGNGRQCTFVESSVVSFPISTFQSPQYGLDILVTDTDPTPVVGGELKTRADLARENMLDFLSLDSPQLYSNVDLMRLVLETPGQDLVIETSASIATHYARYAGSL